MNYGSPISLYVNLTPAFQDAYTLAGLQLEYNYDGNWANGIAGSVANSTPATGQMSFVIPGNKVKWGGNDGTLWFRINQWNTNGDHQYSSDIFTATMEILDTDQPMCWYMGNWSATNSYDQPVHLMYNVTKQPNSSGFDFVNGNISLYYTVNRNPSNVGDRDGAIPYDPSLNPSLDTTNWSTGASYLNFTIPGNTFSYGQIIRHWVVATDRAGNSNSTFNSIKSYVVNDTTPITPVPAAANTANNSIEQDKYVTFTVSKPAHAAQPDPSSITCQWNITVGSSTQCGAPTQNGYDYTFTIPAASAQYNRLDLTVSFRMNASDYAGNKFSQLYSYQVTDMQIPLWTPIYQNFTLNPNYNNDTVVWNATFSIPNPSIGSAKLSTAFLYLNNGTPAGNVYYSSSYSQTAWENDTVSGKSTVNLGFVVNPIQLSARQNIYYLIQINNTRFGVLNITGNFTVKDSIPPFVQFFCVANSTGGSFYNYNSDLVLTYLVQEPLAGSGFNAGLLSLTGAYYKVGSSPSFSTDGVFTQTTNVTLNANGGLLIFRIPEAAFGYNQRVWFWVNITDAQYNANNTYPPTDLSRSVLIGDNIGPGPFFSWDGKLSQNQVNISYNLAKTIHLDANEPNSTQGASGITNLFLFWRRDIDVSGTSYDGMLDMSSYILTYDGGSMDVALSNAIASDVFWFNRTVHIVFEIKDAASNVYNTTNFYFNVTDTVAPSYSIDALNPGVFIDVPGGGKSFTFTVSDPDYSVAHPLSSGILRTDLWYQIGTGSWVYFGTSTPGPAGGVVTFTIPYNSNFLTAGTFSYMLNVFDNASNMATTGALQINMVQTLIMTVTSPVPTPWSDKYYTSSQDLTFKIQFTGTLPNSPQPFAVVEAAWYQVDSGAVNGPIFSDSTGIATFLLIGVTEGNHQITVWDHAPTTQLGQLSFKVDLTPPATVQNLQATVVGETVKLTWSAVSDDDPIIYKVYRGSTPNFALSEGVLIADNLKTTSFVDQTAVITMTTYYYEVFAIDPAGNISKVATASITIPLPFYVWLIILGVAAGAAVGAAMYVRSRREHARIVSDLEKLDQKGTKAEKDDDWSKVAEAARKRQAGVRPQAEKKAVPGQPEAPKWAAIRTGASSKPAATQTVAGQGAYWESELGQLMAKVAELDEAKNYTETLRVLEIVERVARQSHNQEALHIAQQKIKDLWAKINEGN